MPGRWRGDRNRLRARRERPYQSRQRTVSRASVDIQVVPDTLSLVLTEFAPTVATPVVVTPGVRALALTSFVPVVATPRVVTPGKASLTLSTSPPAIATPRVVTPGAATLALATFAPTASVTANITVTPGTAALTLTGLGPFVQGSPPISTIASGSGTAAVIRESLRRPGPPWKPKEIAGPHEDLPEAPVPLEAVYLEPKLDNQAAFAALYAAGALSEDEFVALLAA